MAPIELAFILRHLYVTPFSMYGNTTRHMRSPQHVRTLIHHCPSWEKNVEIQSLEEKLKAARIHVKALEDVLRAIDGSSGAAADDGESALRKGSLVDRARDLVLERGAPMHIDDILKGLGRDVSRGSKASLAGSLAAYVRKEEIFTRPAPNTFGLIELEHFDANEPEGSPPKGFGLRQIDVEDEIPF